jgi:hypothetical protein
VLDRRLTILSVLLLGWLAACGGSGGAAVQPGSSGNGEPAVLQLSGSPGTQVMAGSAYSFTPTEKPATAGVTFSVRNAPPWASFDTHTGTLSGTPQADDVGTYADIVISATAEGASASLAPFSIQVLPAPPPVTGSLTLMWDPPTTYVDGSPLTELSGYRIWYGQKAGALTQALLVTDPNATSFVIDDLSGGTWYFSVQALTTDGEDSALSDVASGTIG